MLKHISAMLFCAAVSGCVEHPEATVPEPEPTIVKIDVKEVFCLAKNIYFEARSEPVQGLVAVAQVTINRVNSDKFPNTVCGVIYEARTLHGVPIKHKCQFSWYCDGKPDIINYNSPAWDKSLRIAELVITDDHPNIVGDSLYYHADYVSPGWARTKKLTTKIGRHLFYHE